MDEHWSAQAAALLDFAVVDGPTRALRTAAIYASLFEEDPVLHEWCGVSALFARLHAATLRLGTGFYDEPMAEWSRRSYDLVAPAILALRAGAPVGGPLSAAMELLSEAAQSRKKKDRDLTLSLARQGTEALLAQEQALAVQPVFDGKPEIIYRGLGPYVGIDLGETTPDGLIYPGEDFHRLAPRQRWMGGVVLPAFREALATDGAGLVAQIRQMQIKGWLRPAELPPRQPAPGPASP